MDLTACVGWSNYPILISCPTVDDTNETENHGPFDDVKYIIDRYEKAGINLMSYQQNHEWNSDDLDSVDDDGDAVPLYGLDPVDIEDGIYRSRDLRSNANVAESTAAGDQTGSTVSGPSESSPAVSGAGGGDISPPASDSGS